MKRLVSLLAIALVSSLFAAGCGKLVNCADAKKKEECVAEKFEGKFTCEWKKVDDAATAETCVDNWKANDAAAEACKTLGTDQGKCDGDAAKAATVADATATCKWSGEAGKQTCQVAKLVAKK